MPHAGEVKPAEARRAAPGGRAARAALGSGRVIAPARMRGPVSPRAPCVGLQELPAGKSHARKGVAHARRVSGIPRPGVCTPRTFCACSRASPLPTSGLCARPPGTFPRLPASLRQSSRQAGFVPPSLRRNRRRRLGAVPRAWPVAGGSRPQGAAGAAGRRRPAAKHAQQYLASPIQIYYRRQ